MPSPSIPAPGRSDFLEQLVAVWRDPQVKHLARGRAGDPDLAEDALQETYYAMARARDPQQIEDVRAYFCRVLVRKIHYLRGQLMATVVDDFVGLADACGRKLVGEARPLPFDEAVNTELLVRKWLRCLVSRRAALLREIPGRSPEPSRYRDSVETTAEWMLLAILGGDFRREDLNQALRAAYREWFAEEGAASNNIQQRLSRGRADVSDLLLTIVSRDDLNP